MGRQIRRDSGAAAGMGRLSAGPHPALFKLLYERQYASDRQEVLPELLRIDAAHVVMLERTRILPPQVAAELLRANRDLVQRVRSGQPVLPAPSVHRGLYVVYERHYIDRLGSHVGGAAHVARSRNDINATVTRLRLRSELVLLLAAGLELTGAALGLARRHAHTPMSGFTHLQPAQPTTFGHYLAAVTCELLRSLERLTQAFSSVNRSPLGAGAGWGTSFPIDPKLTASLLGFAGVARNSLEAVASRDYAIDALAAVATLVSTLTRLSWDLQAWGSHAYGFLRWPDPLLSTSSIMPQKRNAFVLEAMRAQATAPLGALVAVLLALKNTPFANSVEVTAGVTAQLSPALTAAATAVQLATLVLRETTVDAVRAGEFLRHAETTMTAVVNHLVVRHGLPFRTAHEAVGRALAALALGESASAAALAPRLHDAVGALTGRDLRLSIAEIAELLDPGACLRAARHGGGPAPDSVVAQLRELTRVQRRLAASLAARRRRLAEAERRLNAAVTRLLAASPQPPQRKPRRR